MMRVVVDNNVLISGWFWGGNPLEIYRAAIKGKFILLITDELKDELTKVLLRPKFTPMLNAINQTVNQIVNDYQQIALQVDPVAVPVDVIRDPKDRAILACAVGGQANYIVSGDKDLLVLKMYQQITILSAKQFLELLNVPS